MFQQRDSKDRSRSPSPIFIDADVVMSKNKAKNVHDLLSAVITDEQKKEDCRQEVDVQGHGLISISGNPQQQDKALQDSSTLKGIEDTSISECGTDCGQVVSSLERNTWKAEESFLQFQAKQDCILSSADLDFLDQFACSTGKGKPPSTSEGLPPLQCFLPSFEEFGLPHGTTTTGVEIDEESCEDAAKQVVTTTSPMSPQAAIDIGISCEESSSFAGSPREIQLKFLFVLKSATQIGRMTIPPGRPPLSCRVCSVESPSLFWVQIESTCISERIGHEISESFLNSQTPRLTEFRVGLYCACQGPNGDWRRALVVELPELQAANGTKLARVFYIDYGTFAFVALTSLRQLPDLHFYYKWQVFPGSGSPNKSEWSERAVELFKNMVQDKVRDVQSQELPGSQPPEDYILRVNVFEKTESAENKSDPVLKSIAASLSLQSKRLVGFKKDQKVEEGRNFYANPCSNMLLSPPKVLEAWQEGKGTSNLPVVSLHHRLPPERDMRRDTDQSFKGPILVGANPTDPRLYCGPQIKDVELSELNPEWLTEDGDLLFYLAHLVDPSEFYIHPVRKNGSCGRNEELRTLSNNLDEFYSLESNRRTLDATTLAALISERMFGIVDRGHRPGSEEIGIWQRVELCEHRFVGAGGINARMRYNRQGARRYGEVEDAALTSIKVRFLDYGGSEWMLAAHICVIDKRFCACPALAWRCSLCGVRGTEKDGRWSHEATQYFRRIMRSDISMKGIVFDRVKEKGEKGPPVFQLIVNVDEAGSSKTIQELMINQNLALEHRD